MLLKFESMSRPIQLAQGMKLLPHMMRAFARWPYREVPRAWASDVMLNVLHEEGRYSIEAPWLKGRQNYVNAAELAHALTTHVARGWIIENPGMLWLGGAAAEFGDQIVVFVGGPRAGKSLLMASLAAAGNRVFADSILPVSPEDQCGRSLGLAPRIKRPLPREFAGEFRRLAESQVECGIDEFGYLSPAAGRLANFGDRARIRAFVILDRSVSSSANLSPASTGKLVKRLLLNSFGEGMAADALLKNVENMVGDAACYRLAWSDPQEAVSLLRARFAPWRKPADDNASETKAVSRQPARRRPSGPRVPAGRLFRRRDGLREHLVDSDLFLVNPGGQTIYHLNVLGAGLWQLLNGSYGLDDAVSILGQAFPEIDPATIEYDVKTLVQDLTDRGLLIERL
jgi:hypothetical protein